MIYKGGFRSNLPETYWQTVIVCPDGSQKAVNDTCPVMRGSENDAGYYLRIVPYGSGNQEIDGTVQNCDLLTYVYPPPFQIKLKNFVGSFLPLIKQRGGHSETAYIDPESGKAHQVALWGDSPSDRLFHAGNTGTNKINIYRLDLSPLGVTPEREKLLKRELLRWKRVFNRHTFPNGASMNYDPVDFTTTGELADLARALLRRSPDTPPPVAHVNCVQWVCQTVSLALNFPLTPAVVRDLGVTDEFEKNWARCVGGYAEETLEGIGCLPIRFYTPARLIQKALDMYAPGTSVCDTAAKFRPSGWEGALEPYLKAQGVPLDPAVLGRYLKQVVSTGDLDTPFNVPGLKLPYQVVMPSTFILEEREHSLKPTQHRPIIRYVATAIPVGETSRV